MKKISVVLVGIGGYGSIYVNEILKPENRERFKLAGIVDPFPASCKRLAELSERCGEPYATLDQFYSERTADLAVIATPIQFHTENIMSALAHGSDVLCEKPLCGDARDIERLLSAEEKSGHHVSIGYQWSHSEAIQKLKADISSGIYGEPKELRTLVLWPRDRRYFGRGTGWAGKIRAADGSLIYDSVANNAAAHYLHNMFYITGGAADRACRVTDVTATLARVNDIENFDTSIIRCTLEGGATALFAASHTIDTTVNPIFDYKFTRGRVTFSQDPPPASLEGAGGYSVGRIVGVTDSGETRDYGDPFLFPERKLHVAASVASGEGSVICGIRAASEHTRLINRIGETFDIASFRPGLIRERGELLYVEGLAERLISVYDGRSDTISDMLK